MVYYLWSFKNVIVIDRYSNNKIYLVTIRFICILNISINILMFLKKIILCLNKTFVNKRVRFHVLLLFNLTYG